MTEKSYPYTGASAATETDWSVLVRSMGALDGIMSDDPASTALKVGANGTSTVTIEAGTALVNGFVYINDVQMTKAVPVNSGSSARIDRVVLRSSQTLNATAVTYVTGGTSAPALAVDRNDVFDLPLAQLTVAAGSSVALASNVSDQRYFYGKPIAVSNSSSRRPPTRGQVIVEGSAAAPVLLVGTGSGWVQFYPPTAPSWSPLPLFAGWANYGSSFQSARYTKLVSGLVIVQGLVKATSARPASNGIGSLPAGYRPSATHLFSEDYTNTAGHARVDVRADGTLATYSAVASGDYVSLSGIIFPAEQ